MAEVLYKTILQRARELITNKKDWAQDTDDIGIGTQNCALTAISSVAIKQTLNPARALDQHPYLLVSNVIRNSFNMSLTELVNYNDTHEHHEVLKLFDTAIEKL
jgi:hypothetical protein